MKNFVIIVLSVVLAHFKLSPASTPEVVYEGSPQMELVETLPEVIELPEIIIEAPVPEKKSPEAPTREQKRFKAKKAVNIQSAHNTINRQFHQELSNSSRMVQQESLRFQFDDFELKNSDDFNQIMSIADRLIFNPELKVSLSGNTDNIGADYYNDVLSYNRVENVKSYLIELGVSAEQIIVSFNGEHTPIADNETEEGRFDNRRVEMSVYQ